MRPSVLTAHALGAALMRMVFLAAVIGGVVAMHTLGHAATHHDDGLVPASVIVSEPAGSTTAGMGSDADGIHRNAGSVGSDTNGAGHCRSEHAPGCPEHDFDYASVCVAVLTAAVALMAGLLHAWPTSSTAAVQRPSTLGVAGHGSGLPPPRTPSLAQLAVLRI